MVAGRVGSFCDTVDLMIFLPKFSLPSSPINSRGAFSRPSVMSSRYLTRPSRSQPLMSARKSGYWEAKSQTMKPRKVSRLTRMLCITSGTRFGPAGSSVAL